MVDNFECFEKFVIKQIVNTVEYHPETDEYKINRIHISDDIINIIEEEGVRYGLKRQQIDQIISQIAENVRTKPTIKLRYDSIDVALLKIGLHFRINILHPEKGLHYIELLVTDKNHFFVLSSDITGVRYGDELLAKDSIWNNGYYIDFSVICGNGKPLVGKPLLRLGKLYNIEMYGPSIVHEILDSDSTFTYDSINHDQNNQTADKGKDYFFWIPNKYKPITFCWREGDAQDVTSPFIITDNEEVPEAKISINKGFCLPTEEKMVNSLMEIIFDCCKWKNAFNGIENLKYVKSVKSGVAKRVVSELGYKEWELIKQPQIKFIYE